MAKKYFYAVQNGRSKGVFNSWDECKSQTIGYNGAVYKKFTSQAEAQSFASNNSGYSGAARSKTGNIRAPPSSSISNMNSAIYRTSLKGSVSKPKPRPSNSLRNLVAGARKYYAVKSSNPNTANVIFSNWNDCKNYVRGQKGLSFKKFESEIDATNFINGASNDAIDYKFMKTSESEFVSKYSIPSISGKKFSRSNTVYCDGSSLNNGTATARSGYGAYFEGEPEYNISERLKLGAQTNNRGEIQAVSRALDTIWDNLTTKEDKTTYKIKSDSEYVVKLLNDRYSTYSSEKMNSIPNKDLVDPLIEKFARVKKYYEINKDLFMNGGKFQLEWVKGHSGHEGNEIADDLARRGAAQD